jgi:hypothetical protein
MDADVDMHLGVRGPAKTNASNATMEYAHEWSSHD